MTDSAAGKAPAKTGHAERLYVPWYWWLPPLLAAGLLAAEVHLGYPGVRAWLPYVVLLPLTAVLIWRAGRAPVRIDGDQLFVGTAHLPLAHVGTVEVFGAAEKRKVLGRELDPTAFVLHRGWVGPTVRVEVTDPEDPTPYWVFSTRRPEKVASLLNG
ncbi:DUF3093 domain-containing protein [Actinophytocola oryzae]|uniref:DUF3093 family protein n=1 Tax=Actinophytocola oryzae TaxID=502181 RepID=A0A4R7UUE5_9PSEU|nr:DUF3093 domain-containing protein [Actinophytocola oryzae]TDV40293.1 Protein of unknown function (DUF3093) [Actinophytocola oryzae]